MQKCNMWMKKASSIEKLPFAERFVSHRCAGVTATTEFFRYIPRQRRFPSIPGENMFAHVLADGRLLGFDSRDWSMLVGGVFAIGSLLMLLA